MRAPALAPPPPREPTPVACDLIFRYAGKQKLELWVGVIFTLVGAPLSLVFGWGLPGDLALRLFGAPTTAIVRGAHVDESVEINGVNPTVVAFYREEGGLTLEGRSTFTDRSPEQFQPGAEVPAEAVEGHPEWARLQGGTYSTFGLIGLFTALFPLVGLLLLGHAVRGNRREIRAFTHGVVARGQVVRSGEDRSYEYNGKHPWTVDWEFEVEGERYTGSLSNMNHALLSHLATGTKVTVLHLRGAPKVNTLYLE